MSIPSIGDTPLVQMTEKELSDAFSKNENLNILF